MEIEVNDAKHGLAGVGAILSWAFAHSNEIGFIVATSVSVLTATYLIQGIILRNRELKGGQK